MNSPKWVLVKRDFQSASHHFHMAEEIHNDGPSDERKGAYVQAGAFMHAVQSGHTSLEAGFSRIFKLIGEPAPHDVDDWHAATVDQAFADVDGRGAIFPSEMFADVAETRRARNLAVRGYDTFDMGKSEATARAAGRLAKALPDALQRFIRRIDPQPNLDEGHHGR